jgi:hypothetical protein
MSRKVSFFAHPNFLQSPSNNFILSSYVEACVITLTYLPYLSSSPIFKYYVMHPQTPWKIQMQILKWKRRKKELWYAPSFAAFWK